MADFMAAEARTSRSAGHRMTMGTASTDREMRRVLDLMHDPKEIAAMRAKAESIAWTFVHKVDTYVNGAVAKAPYYRFIATVPEGMIDDRYAPAINRDIFAALNEAEGGKYPMLEGRL